MLKQRLKAVEQVAAVLYEAEAAIDAALNKTAALTATVPVARSDAGLSAMFCQGAVERLSETIAALAQARRGIVEAHKALTVDKIQMGLGDVRLDGGSGTKPPPPAMIARPNLTAVPSESAAA
jgi:hypothetical protein